jgi:hypothetical protein
MRKFFPLIGSRYFLLYWGLLNFSGVAFLALVYQDVMPILYQPIISSVLLARYLKWKQQLLWISCELVACFTFWVSISWFNFGCYLVRRDTPEANLWLTVFQDPYTYRNLMFAIVIWMLIAKCQTYILPLKRTTPWLIGSIAAWTLIFLIAGCFTISTKDTIEPVEQSPLNVFLFGVIKPGLTGLGLYFSTVATQTKSATPD